MKMTQIDIELTRYEANLSRAVERKLPEAVIQQYHQYIIRKTEEKEQQLENRLAKY